MGGKTNGENAIIDTIGGRGETSTIAAVERGPGEYKKVLDVRVCNNLGS